MTKGPTSRSRRPTRRPDSLRKILDGPGLPAQTLGYHEMQGFLFTVASAPELVMPSEWIPQVFGPEPEFKSKAQVEKVMAATMALYNEINAQVLARRVELPDGVVFREDPLENLDEGAPVAAWSRGFKLGHDWLDLSWKTYLPDGVDQELDDELGALLMTLTFFSSRKLAEAYWREATGGKQPLARMATMMQKVFPDAMAGYAFIGRTSAELLANRPAAQEEAPAGPTVGRNEPCPCGSGKKFKRCCGA